MMGHWLIALIRGKRALNGILRDAIFLVVALSMSGWSGHNWGETKTARVGVLLLNEENQKQPALSPFIPGLAQRGWIQGKNLVIESRYARGNEMGFTEAAEELVRLKVDVILAASAPAVRAAFSATQSIPIVGQDYTNDPIAAGYAQSYSRPGKNLTGVFLDAPEFAGKWIDLLRLIVPSLKRIAVLWDPAPGPAHRLALQRVAQSLGIKVQVQEIRSPADFEKAFARFRGRPQALVILPSPLAYTYSARLAELALKHRLPATSMARGFAETGGAISYGPNNPETTERNAAQVAKILDGAKPGDLPIERPNKFDFLVNMKTMQALGLKVPDTLLLGAELVNK